MKDIFFLNIKVLVAKVLKKKGTSDMIPFATFSYFFIRKLQRLSVEFAWWRYVALASLSGKISGVPLKFCKRSAAHLIFS
jgi:hypothetical protein